jgi:hypothetical protein
LAESGSSLGLVTKQEVVDAATSRPVVSVDFETSRLFWKVATMVRVDGPIWKDERNMPAPIEKAVPTSIAGAALFLLHAASYQAAPHGLVTTALYPIRAGDYRYQLLRQDNNSVKTN